jgi:hypothetical protein
MLGAGKRWPPVKLGQGAPPPAGLGKGMYNWLGKVRLGKVLLSYNYKNFQRAKTFSQGPLKFICAIISFTYFFINKNDD